MTQPDMGDGCRRPVEWPAVTEFICELAQQLPPMLRRCGQETPILPYSATIIPGQSLIPYLCRANAPTVKLGTKLFGSRSRLVRLIAK